MPATAAPTHARGLQRRRRRLLAWLGGALWVPARAQSPAKAFPQRPVQIVVPFGPGGIADVTARAVGEAMSRRLGQPVVIDNRPGAGGIVAAQAVARAKADGHTLLLMSNGTAVSVGLFRQLPFDPRRDFTGVGTIGAFDLGVFVAADARWKTLAALVDEARRRPGALNVGTIAIGSTQHLAAKLFETVAGVSFLVVPYPGSPAVVTALRGGQIDVAFEIVGPMLPQVRAGAVRALAVSSGRRSPALPAVPTVAEAGVAGYDVASWNGLAAPAGTPPAAIATLNAALREAVASPAVQAPLVDLGVRLDAGSPAELDALLAREIARWGAVIRAAKITPE